MLLIFNRWMAKQFVVKIEYCWIKEKSEKRNKISEYTVTEHIVHTLTYFVKSARHKECK